VKNILIIGDSHASKLGNCIPNVFLKDNQEVEFKDSDQHYTSRYIEDGKIISVRDLLRTYEDSELKIWISSHPGRSALNYDFENFASGTQKYVLDDWNAEGNIVLPWLGYIDIRNWLPQPNILGYKPASEVVSIYMDNVLNKFNKCKVIFIEPLPQFVCFITSGWIGNESDPDINFEKRYEQHIIFVEELKKQCFSKSLDAPISVSNILGTDMIEPYMQPKKPLKLFLNDHMTQPYYEKIIYHVAKNI
jgi:hypothetical protein